MAKAYCEDCLKTKFANAVADLTEKRLADCLCYDCEIYVCSSCFTEHSDHAAFSTVDKSNKPKLEKFCEEMIEKLTSEGAKTLEKFTQERTHICDLVDAGSGKDAWFTVVDICILRESKQWVITDRNDKRIKVFNINNNEMTASISIKHEPYGITEIPSTVPSHPLVALSFPYSKHIDIWSIHSEPAQIISSIKVSSRCYDLANCNNQLIVRCRDYRGRSWCDVIHVMDISGEIINIIDLHKLPAIKLNWYSSICMAVHSKSETIYVCHYRNPSCVISISLNGQVLHSVMLTEIMPQAICVDGDQTVYIAGDKSPLFKMSPDLNHIQKAINKEFLDGWFPKSYHFSAIACHADTFYLARMNGNIYIIRHE